jgi:hypothetical protein
MEIAGKLMKKALFLIDLALLAAPVCAVAGASPARAPSPPASSPLERPSLAALEASRQAVAQTDIDRLFRDQVYATAILGHADRLAAIGAADPEFVLGIDNVRLLALAALSRPEEVRATVDSLLAARPTQARYYVGPWLASVSIQDFERAVATIETASRNVPGVSRADVRSFLMVEVVGSLLANLHFDHHEDLRVRLAQALFRLGWPGDDDSEMADRLRQIMMEERLRAGDGTAASGFAASITTPRTILEMIVQTRYDPVLAPGQDRLTLVQEALGLRDRQTAGALAAAPQNLRIILDRAHYLSSVDRNAQAMALLQPYTNDVAATVARGEYGRQIVNDASYMLVALGRRDEGLRLMRRLAALPITGSGALINSKINNIQFLVDTGHYQEALDEVRGLQANGAEMANDYGKAWIDSGAACALAGLHRNAEAAPLIERLRALGETNPGALTKAYLCLGDDDGAAAIMVRRLGSDEPVDAILALQDYSAASGSDPDPIYQRLRALRDRPGVRDALARVGRVMSLPLPRAYWGSD